jgi:ribosome-binding factor A
MKFFRSERVSSLIQEELNKLILKEIDISGALVTITRIEVAKNLERAIVNFSVIPSDKAERTLEVLQKNRSHLQRLLNKKINIRPMPEISFKIDYGPEKAAGVERALLNK